MDKNILFIVCSLFIKTGKNLQILPKYLQSSENRIKNIINVVYYSPKLF